jgi:hypothetical protein
VAGRKIDIFLPGAGEARQFVKEDGNCARHQARQ